MATSLRDESRTGSDLGPAPAGPTRRTGAWVAGLILAALVAFAAGYAVRAVTDDEPEGVVEGTPVDVIDDALAALDEHTAEAVGAVFADDAVLWVHTAGMSQEFQGPEDIAQAVSFVGDIDRARTSEVVRVGDLYAAATTVEGGQNSSMAVFGIQGTEVTNLWLVLQSASGVG